MKPAGRLTSGILALGVGIVLLAAAVRFHHLGRQSFWNDEGSSYVQATRSFADIAANAARDIHPPGYYWLLAVWRGLVGNSEVALRAFSTLASVLSAAFTFALGKKLFHPAAGLAAATLVALNTFSIYYAQEARMYALLALWGVMGMWALVGLVSTPTPALPRKQGRGFRSPFVRWGVVLALINTAGLYTQYAYPFVMLAQGAIFVVWMGGTLLGNRNAGVADGSPLPNKGAHTQRYMTLGVYVAANVVTIALFAPWMPTALRQVTQWPSTGTPIPPLDALGIIGGWFGLGVTYPFVDNASAYLPVALLLLSGGLIGWLWLRGRKAVWPLLVPIMWAGLPVLLFLALGLFRPANLKFLLPAQIGFALAMGAGLGGWWGLARRGYRLDRLTLILALLQGLWLLAYLANGLDSLYNDPHFQRADYRSMVQLISAHPREGDAIILDAPNQEEVFRYYYHDDAPVYPLPAGLGGNDAQTLVDVQAVIRQSKRIFVLFWGESERDPHHIVEDTLNSATFAAGQSVWYGDVRFAQYVTPVTMPTAKTIHKRFGDSILLERAAVSATTFRPGDVVQIRLEWQTDAALDKRYKVFVQLLNTGGVLVAQRDSEPVGGSQPTTTWVPGSTVIDQHGLALPTDLAPGDYQIIVGLYDADDPNQRLPAAGKTYVSLGYIAVIAP